MMEHVEIVDRWDSGDPELISADTKVQASNGDLLLSPFFTVVYEDDHSLMRAQQSDDDES